ncbi:hypothetical protein EYC58_05435 [Candidatus Saccharibacteria bacterium]|nr:MAG: hypothetical protein EYC58_05435 [Candidatus Saccharibacteria bacterium]
MCYYKKRYTHNEFVGIRTTTSREAIDMSNDDRPTITITVSIANLSPTTSGGEETFCKSVDEAVRMALTTITTAAANREMATSMREREPTEPTNVSMTAVVRK